MNNSKNDSKCAEPPFTAKEGGFFFTLLIIIDIIFALIFSALLGQAFEQSSAAFRIIYALCNAIGYIVALWVFFYLIKVNPAQNLKSLRINGFHCKYLLCALLLFVGMTFGMGGINLLFAELCRIPPVELIIGNVWEYLALVFSMAVLPAVIEEFMFRSIALGSLNKENGFVVALVTALCFALFHKSAAQFVYQFFFGFFLAYLVKESRSVFPAVIAHFCNNFLILTLAFANVQVYLFDFRLILVGAICLAAFLFITFLPKIKSKKTAERANKQSDEQSDGQTNRQTQELKEPQELRIKTKFYQRGTAKYLLFASVGIVFCVVLAVAGAAANF